MTIAIVFGTRPEGIKLAPVLVEARRRGVDVLAVSTGQHRDMLRPVLGLFGIAPDVDLELMRPGQTLADLTARAITETSALIERVKPRAVVVQGDTTTAMAAALAAFYLRIPVAHVEAGLRSDRLDAPFPEEANRRIASQIARWHFAPTERAREMLLRDRVDILGGEILVTGNTVIDALYLAVEAVKKSPPQDDGLVRMTAWKKDGGRVLLVTGHRRENFGEPFREFCLALRDIAQKHPRVLVAYPVHLNPNVQQPVNEILGGVENVALLPPAEYPAFVAMMMAADVIVTDSGGVQEEGPALAKPVVVTRDVTERPEAVEAGGVVLTGPHRDRIVATVDEILGDGAVYTRMAQVRLPYGDGKAAERIVDVLEKI